MMRKRPLFLESFFESHFWVFLEKCIKCPIFIGTLGSLHHIEERERGHNESNEVPCPSPFFISSSSYCFHISKSPVYMRGKLEEFPLASRFLDDSGSARADFGPWWVTRSEEVQITPSKVGLGTNLKMKRRTWEKQL